MAERFQFSIRFLLVATAAVGAAVAMLSSEPSWKSAVAIQILAVLFATAAVVAATITRGALQAFWIGAALDLFMAGACTMHVITMASVQHIMGPDYATPTFETLRIVLLTIWCAAPLNGIFAIFVRWLFTPRKPSA